METDKNGTSRGGGVRQRQQSERQQARVERCCPGWPPAPPSVTLRVMGGARVADRVACMDRRCERMQRRRGGCEGGEEDVREERRGVTQGAVSGALLMRKESPRPGRGHRKDGGRGGGGVSRVNAQEPGHRKQRRRVLNNAGGEADRQEVRWRIVRTQTHTHAQLTATPPLIAERVRCRRTV